VRDEQCQSPGLKIFIVEVVKPDKGAFLKSKANNTDSKINCKPSNVTKGRMDYVSNVERSGDIPQMYSSSLSLSMFLKKSPMLLKIWMMISPRTL
jgi:hypothetical protein